MNTSASSESSMINCVQECLDLKCDTCQMIRKSKTDDIEYVIEILNKIGLAYSKCLSSYYLICGKGDSDSLYFEAHEDAKEFHDKGKKLRRKLFDCVQECLDLKCDIYFRTGYEAWAKGITLIRKDLAEEFCQEISVWKSMKDMIVDDLVDNDMSTNLGKWVDFRWKHLKQARKFRKRYFAI